MSSDFKNKMLFVFAFLSAFAGFTQQGWLLPAALAILLNAICRTAIAFHEIGKFDQRNWNRIFRKLKTDLLAEIVGGLLWMYVTFVIGRSIYYIYSLFV